MTSMSYNKAAFFLQEMISLWNESSLRREVLDVHSMPSERLAEIAAAYGVTDVGGSFSDRERLRVGLQEGSFGVWSLARLNAHREKSGGSWKELRPGKRRKLADE